MQKTQKGGSEGKTQIGTSVRGNITKKEGIQAELSRQVNGGTVSHNHASE